MKKSNGNYDEERTIKKQIKFITIDENEKVLKKLTKTISSNNKEAKTCYVISGSGCFSKLQLENQQETYKNAKIISISGMIVNQQELYACVQVDSNNPLCFGKITTAKAGEGGIHLVCYCE